MNFYLTITILVTIFSFLRRLGPQSHETLDLASGGIPLSSPIDCFTVDPICQLFKPVVAIDRTSSFLKLAFLKYANAELSPQTLSFLMLILVFNVSFGSQQPRARRNISPPPGTSTRAQSTCPGYYGDLHQYP